MKKIILGVDGGATKSHLAVFDDEGNCAGAAAYGPLNHECMEGSYDELEVRLGELLPRVLEDAGASPSDVAFAVFGMAGVDTKWQGDLVSDMVRKIGIEQAIVCNDAVLGVPAGCPNGVGVCAINGTGFKVAAIDRSGVILETCGLGGYTDDKGGGSWYGERACAEVYNELFKFGKPTKMRDMLLELLGISDKWELMTKLQKINAGEYPYGSVELNSIPFRAAAMLDDAALDILEDSTIQYAGAIAQLATDMDFPPDEVLYVTLAGSVFVKQKAQVFIEMVRFRLSRALGSRKFVCELLDTIPVAGAVLWAAQKAGFLLNPDSVKAALVDAGL